MTFSLINLTGSETIEFDFFPRSIRTETRNNWEQQDVTIGARPLFYANRDARTVQIDELYLDGSGGESIAPQIEALEQLYQETERGSPPMLLAQWGDRSIRAVLGSMSIEEIYFSENGDPLRARVTLTLLEVTSDERPRRVSQRVRRNEESSFTF